MAEAAIHTLVDELHVVRIKWKRAPAHQLIIMFRPDSFHYSLWGMPIYFLEHMGYFMSQNVRQQVTCETLTGTPEHSIQEYVDTDSRVRVGRA